MNNFKSITHKFIPEPKLREESLMLRWDYKGHRNTPAGVHYLQHDWNVTLVTRINECRNWLHTNYDGDENIYDFNTITSSPSCVMIFESMPYFTMENYREITLGPIEHAGILMGRYVVGLDNEMREDRIYLGTQEQPKLACIFVDNLGL